MGNLCDFAFFNFLKRIIRFLLEQSFVFSHILLVDMLDCHCFNYVILKLYRCICCVNCLRYSLKLKNALVKEYGKLSHVMHYLFMSFHLLHFVDHWLGWQILRSLSIKSNDVICPLIQKLLCNLFAVCQFNDYNFDILNFANKRPANFISCQLQLLKVRVFNQHGRIPLLVVLTEWSQMENFATALSTQILKEIIIEDIEL